MDQTDTIIGLRDQRSLRTGSRQWTISTWKSKGICHTGTLRLWKMTTLRMIAGFDNPTKGTFFERSIITCPYRPIIRSFKYALFRI